MVLVIGITVGHGIRVVGLDLVLLLVQGESHLS